MITVKANKFVCGGGDETKTLIIFIALYILRVPDIILRFYFREYTSLAGAGIFLIMLYVS